MLESFTEKQEGRGKRLTKVLVGSLCLHGLLLAVVLFLDHMRIDPVPEPAAMVTFVDFASLPPPPPPPPPPKKKSSKPKEEPKVEQPKPQPKISEFLAPKEIPQEKAREPDEPETSDDDGVEGGVEGGVVGGVVGGVIGGMMDAPPPPPPPPAPPPPTYQAPEVIKKRRMAGAEPEYPRIARAAGLEAVIMVKIYITPEGNVGEMTFIKTDKHFEKSVREAIQGWRFSPHMINGRPVGTYTVYKFVFKLE